MPQSAPGQVTAQLKFLADRTRPLAYVPSRGGGDETEHLGNFSMHAVEIHNARAELQAMSLDREGFLLARHESAVQDFYDDQQLRDIYHAEVEALLMDLTGARRVEVFDDTRRSSSVTTQRERGIREPASIVHNDYTAASGVRRAQDFLADRPEESRRLLQGRFAIINVWRSIAGPVEDHPLVLCDATTTAANDLVAVERRGEDRTGELQVALYQPRQRWFYFPGMQPGEVLLFKTFDSAQDGRTRFTPHSSFSNPAAAGNAPPRQSLETRCLAFF